MPFEDYQDLQRNVLNWSVRPDLEGHIPDFVYLAEKQIQRDMKLSFTETETTSNMVANQDYINLPTDCLEPRNISLDVAQGPKNIAIVSAHEFKRWKRALTSQSEPRVATPQARRLMLTPGPADTYAYTLWYWAGIVPLSDAVTSNWLLENGPDVLLYQSLKQLQLYTGEEGRLPTTVAEYKHDVETLRRLEWRQRTGGGPLEIRTDVQKGRARSRV